MTGCDRAGGRRGTIATGALLTLLALAVFGSAHVLLGVLVAYVLLQATISAARAGQQALLPDLVPAGQRGTASGLKGFMDVGGALLAALTLITVLAAMPAGWAADRLGRLPLMLVGSGLGIAGVAVLAVAHTAAAILLGGSVLALGSAAFTGANWALTAARAPAEQAGRFFGLANAGTAGGAAAAGLFGPRVDWGNSWSAGAGYTVLFMGAALPSGGSALALRGLATAVPDARAPIAPPAGQVLQEASR